MIDTIVCPQCQAALAASADACPHCGAATVAVASLPTNQGDTHETKRLIDKPWLIVILILHVGLLGIPLYWKTSYSLVVRLWLIVASIVYTVFAVAAIVMILWKIARDLGLAPM